MDTDCLYFALNAEKLEQVIKLEIREELRYAETNDWRGSNSTPGFAQSRIQRNSRYYSVVHQMLFR